LEANEMASANELTPRVDKLEERVSNHIKFFWAAIAVGFAWLAVISVQLFNIRADIQPLISTHQLTKAASEPTDSKHQAEVLQIITKAKQTQIPIPTTVLAEAGESFIAASKQDPKAWETVRALMEYRTNVNSLTFIFPPATSPVDTTLFHYNGIKGRPGPVLSYIISGVPMNQAGRVQILGENLNADVKLGPTHYIMRGGVLKLDDMDMAHVILVGVEVHYSGGLTMLQDLLFVDCTFVFDNVDRGRTLAEDIISSRTTDFQAAL
jgi:hypothetical protein